MTDGLNRIPGLVCQMPEGGFYAWLDIRASGCSSGDFCRRLLSEAQVAAVPGASFGPSGEGYVRITCVKKREELLEGLESIRAFWEKHI